MSKQAYLSKEMEPKTIEEIESAAEELQAIRLERIELTSKENEAQSTLVAVMGKHRLKVYKAGKLIVTIKQGKVKAKLKEAEVPEESAEDKE